MSKTWYPIINNENCVACGACMDKCSHGVYSREDGKPVVTGPDGCVEGCHGCQSLCPADAITYFGDDSDLNSQDNGCGCGCGCCS